MQQKYKAVIIDDEQYAIEVLQMLLQKNCENVEIVGSTTQSKDGVALINNLQPNIVFLDIEMPRLNGFQLLEQLPEISFHLIFTTAYDQYAVKAFRYSALDYLMKPIMVKDLQEAINKLDGKRRIDKQHLRITEENLQVVKSHSIPDKIILPHTKGYIFQKIDEIIYCEAMSAYTKFIFDDKPSLVIAKGLGDIEELLKEGGFFRTHRQFLVNTKKIKELLREDGGTLLMSNGVKIPIARNRKDDFLELMK